MCFRLVQRESQNLMICKHPKENNFSKKFHKIIMTSTTILWY